MRQLVALEQSRRDDLVGAGRNASVHPAEQQRREAGARQLCERDLPPRLQHLLPRADHLADEPVAEKREHVAGRGGVAREHVAKVGFVGETRRAPGDRVDHALGRGEAVRHDVEPTDGRAVAPHHPVTRSRDGDRRSLVIDRHRLQPAVRGAERGQRAGQRRLERRARAHPENKGQVAALAQIRIAAHHRQVVDHRRAEQLRERTLAQAQLRLVARRQVVVSALTHAGERGREARIQPFAQLDEVRDVPEAHVVERGGRGGRQRLRRNRASDRRHHRRPGVRLVRRRLQLGQRHRRGFVRRGEQSPIGLQRLLQRRHPGRGVHQARQLGRVPPRHGHARRAARRCARHCLGRRRLRLRLARCLRGGRRELLSVSRVARIGRVGDRLRRGFG